MGNFSLLRRLFQKTLLPEKFPEDVTPENIRKNKVDFQKNSGIRSGRTCSGSFSRRRVFRNTTSFFRKKILPEVILSMIFFKCNIFLIISFLINKLCYKINNIIIHKLLVNIIMTNICNSFFTRM